MVNIFKKSLIFNLLISTWLNKISFIFCSKWEASKNCDLNENIFSNISLPDINICGDTCISFRECTHFTYTSDGICWMKTGPVKINKAENSSHVCGISLFTSINTFDATSLQNQVYNKFTKNKESFQYGRDFDLTNNIDYSQYDYLTIWLGYSHSVLRPHYGSMYSISDLYFDPSSHGFMLETVKKLDKIPVFYSYIIGFAAKYVMGLKECSLASEKTLCTHGPKFISNYQKTILMLYENYSSKIAEYIGRMGFCVFLIEPNFHQYFDTNEKGLTGKEMAKIFDLIVSVIKKHLPNAAISCDINPFLTEIEMKNWWDLFKNSQIDFVHTSRGLSHSNSFFMVTRYDKYDFKGETLSWIFVANLTQKKIIADMKIGLGGMAEKTKISNWYSILNTKNRQNDGLICITFVALNQHTANNYLIENRKIGLNKNENDEILYVILPYFNFAKAKLRRKLFLEFIDRYKHLKEIRLVIGEATVHGNDFDLPKNIHGIYAHHKFILKHSFWCKENLINVVIKKLPFNWTYMAWIDADITFLNENWAKDTIKKLKNKNSYFVQLFETALFMDANDSVVLKNFTSFGFNHQHNTYEWHHMDFSRNKWHAGYAWASTKLVQDEMDGLFEYGIIGSGDYYIAMSMVEKVDAYFKSPVKMYYQNISNEFYLKIKEYEFKWQKNRFKLSYIKGTIKHHWHGSINERKYNLRKNFLGVKKYNPVVDLVRNKDGLISLSKCGERMVHDLENYFLNRKEI